MKFSSLCVASIAVALPCGLNGTAMSQTDATTSLPSVVVGAPGQVARPQQPMPRAVARSTVSPLISPTPATPSASPMSPAERELAKVAIRSSCIDGCVTSFRSGNKPWVGCSVSAGTYSSTCRNVGNYKTYNECSGAGLTLGWRTNETSWYCSSLALK